MRQRTWGIGAAGLMVLAVAGCDAMQLNKVATLAAEAAPAFTFTALADSGHVYYSASVDATSVSLQDVLRSLDLPVTVTKDASGNVRIASSTPDGSHFTLVVQSINSTSTPNPVRQTQVYIEWENQSDNQKIQVLAQLEARKRRQSTPSSRS